MFEKRALGIAFEADGTVSVVALAAGLRSVSLADARTLPPAGTDAFDSWSRALDALRAEGMSVDGAVVGLPDTLVFRKHLEFPFSSRKRIIQILNSELDGEIPISIEAVVADFVPGPSGGPGVQGTAIACEKKTLSRLLDLLGPGTRIRGIQTNAVGAASAFIRAGLSAGVGVHCSQGEAYLIEIRSSRIRTIKRYALSGDPGEDPGQIVEGIREHTVSEDEVYLACPNLSRGIREKLSGEETLRVRDVSDLHPVHLPVGLDADPAGHVSAMGLALHGLGARETVALDLRQGPFKQVTPLAGLRAPLVRTGVLALLVVAMGGASLLADLNRSRSEYETYRDRLETEFKELFPRSRYIDGQETAYLTGELDKLRKRVADLSGFEGLGALSILSALSSAVPEGVSLRLDELSYDSRRLRVEGSVTSFDAVDRIKAALESGPLFTDVQVQNAKVGADINKVTFRLQMEVR